MEPVRHGKAARPGRHGGDERTGHFLPTAPGSQPGHGRTGDPDRNDKAVTYWFKLVRNADKTVDYIPYLIDDNTGVGAQVIAGDINNDGLMDLLTNATGLASAAITPSS